jgi:hypothetical protein
MLVPNISDSELIREFENWKKNQNSKFKEYSYFWLIQNLRKRFNIQEEDYSEIYFLFVKSFDKCISSFIEKNYANLLSYYSIFGKHIFYNIAKLKKLKEFEEFYPEIEYYIEDKKTMSTISGLSTTLVHKYIQTLPHIGRILISLRYNLKMNDKDLEFLDWYLKSNEIDALDFRQRYTEKIYQSCVKREKLMIKINKYNRKIYSSHYNLNKLRNRKRKLVEKVDKTYKVLTIKELSNLLNIKFHVVNYHYTTSIGSLKFKLKSELNRRIRDKKRKAA